MKGFNLTTEELLELRDAHRFSKNKSSAYKINAVILLGTGWTLKKVKDALLLDDETLRDYVSKYRSGGVSGLLETHHKGRDSLLSEAQQMQLCKELDKHIYLTTQSVIEFIKIRYGISYSMSGMRDLLHRLGYEYKKPKLVPGEPDDELQEAFANQYQEFMLNKASDVEVLFMDAVHPEHNAMAAYGWIKRGEKRELKTNSGRERLNLHGVINAESHDVIVIESETVNKESTIQLLELVEKKYFLSCKIYIILDNAKYHYSKEVKAFLKDSKIKLIFLPPYSPNLNLIERLWKFFKKKVLYNQYYKDIKAFRRACIHFFKNIAQHSDEIEKFMNADFELT